jgi:hypothetical protein
MKGFLHIKNNIVILLAFIYNAAEPFSGEASFEPSPEGFLC